MGIDLYIRTITAIQQAWQMCNASTRLYRALAEREPSMEQRLLLLQLAASAEQHADRRADWLRRLSAPLPPKQDTIYDRVWRWILVRRGSVSAIAHVERAVDTTLIRSAILLLTLSHINQRRRQSEQLTIR
jgi:hypothetical protein